MIHKYDVGELLKLRREHAARRKGPAVSLAATVNNSRWETTHGLDAGE
jgi:hypothetical protein